MKQWDSGDRSRQSTPLGMLRANSLTQLEDKFDFVWPDLMKME